MYSVLCTMYSVLCVVSPVPCTMYDVPRTMFHVACAILLSHTAAHLAFSHRRKPNSHTTRILTYKLHISPYSTLHKLQTILENTTAAEQKTRFRNQKNHNPQSPASSAKAASSPARLAKIGPAHHSKLEPSAPGTSLGRGGPIQPGLAQPGLAWPNLARSSPPWAGLSKSNKSKFNGFPEPARDKKYSPHNKNKDVLKRRCWHKEKIAECCTMTRGRQEQQKSRGPRCDTNDVPCKSFAADGTCRFGDKCWFKHGYIPGQRPAAKGEARAFARAPPAAVAAVALAGPISCVLPTPANSYAVNATPLAPPTGGGVGAISLGGAG